MKVALCISGQPRYLEEGYAQIDKNILQKYLNFNMILLEF